MNRLTIKRFFWIIAVLMIVSCAPAQQTPFNRGVNLTGWFQAGSARKVHYKKYSKQDFINIQSLGFDVIRLPINLHYMTDGPPNYILDDIFLENLNRVIDWAEELQIHLILDNHTFSPSIDTDPGVGSILKKVWAQMAQEFADRSEYIYYEILNEPHGIKDRVWNKIQGEVIETIREHDSKRYIVVGPAGWNSYNNLDAMPEYDDDKLIYTFHFYDPFLFTHQGASWNTPSMLEIKNIPFPYDAASMPPMPPAFEGTWVENLYDNYPTDGTAAKVRELIDIAVAFREERQVPIFCGEFGVYQLTSDEADRVRWYETVVNYLDSMNIAWTMWDYHSGFGLFEENSNGLFEHDLNIPLLEAMELNIPEQTEYEQLPDSTGLVIYDDYLASYIDEVSYSDGTLDYFYDVYPNKGKYCIHWTEASRYQAIALDFQPNRDLTRLVDEDYAFDFAVRGTDPLLSFDVRFLDSKTDEPGDLPWRKGITIRNSMVDFDNRWYHLHIPLKNMVEKGAWDGEWHVPIGKFDWSDIDRLEFVPEERDLGQAHLLFDQIYITDMDTVSTDPFTGVDDFTSIITSKTGLYDIKVYPNPASQYLYLESYGGIEMNVQIRDLTGKKILHKDFTSFLELNISDIPPGIYIIMVSDSGKLICRRKLVFNPPFPPAC
ncbi:MAG: cellulase family glycosylhydrolase [Bacteroidota bacterium]|nr:cellulase family glycosylhydrolase [Bacteroidota bacterium]